MIQGLSYNILSEFCKVRNEKDSLKGSENPITNRVQFIIDKILDLKMYEGLNLDIFDDYNETLKYVNIELSFNKNSDKSILFIAHHDINNINSDNCQDNSASVSNLLSLAKHFSENFADKNIHIVFTDCEEFGGKGAKQLSKRINEGIFGDVEWVVNLELTANGTEYWCDSKVKTDLLKRLHEVNNFTEVKTPFNDSAILRREKIDSICIGSLPKKEMESVIEKGKCSTWFLCHKENDNFENAISEDMDKFVELLIKII
jgi:hypothetical protein